MKTETERILQDTPYNSYDDLFGAVYSNKANIRLSNNACRQIAPNTFSNIFGLHFGFIPSVVLTVACAIYSVNYLLLLLLLVEFIFPFVVYSLHIFKVKSWYIAGIIVFCDLFLFKMPLFVFILALSWLFNCWAIGWWIKKIYRESVKILQYNEEAFEWAYNSNNLLIEDCYGNIYSKLRQNELQTMAHERLLRVLKIGAGVNNIDEAITKFSAFYLQKGIEIPNELYWGVAHLSKQEKCEHLLKILELGTGDSGIEQITSRFINFYRSKGIAFPNDI